MVGWCSMGTWLMTHVEPPTFSYRTIGHRVGRHRLRSGAGPCARGVRLRRAADEATATAAPGRAEGNQGDGGAATCLGAWEKSGGVGAPVLDDKSHGTRWTIDIDI